MAIQNGRNRVADRRRTTPRTPSAKMPAVDAGRPKPVQIRAAEFSSGPVFPKDVSVPLRFNATVFTPPTLVAAAVQPPVKTTQRRQPTKPKQDAPPKVVGKAAASRPTKAKTPAATSSAVPLPIQREPLVVGAAPHAAAAAEAVFSRSPQAANNMAPLPRNRSVAAPPVGLWAAIDAWLISAKKLLRAGFVVKQPRNPSATAKTPPRNVPIPAQQKLAPKPKSWFHKAQPAPPSMREQAELTQLRAENRRLRNQIESMIAQQRTREKELTTS